MCVHIMPKEKFTRGFVDFMNDAFSNLDIWFLVYGPEQVGYLPSDSDNVVCADSPDALMSDAICKSLISDSYLIVLNWVHWRLAFRLYHYHRKTVYLFWGGDLEAAVSLERRSPRRLCRAYLFNHARGFITLIPEDRVKAETLSAKHGAWHLGMIVGLTKAALSSTDELSFDKSASPVRVLVGNSATASNNHREVFQMLSAYRNEDLEVLVPLSYGDDNYREEVLALGNELLGRAFHPILGYMDKGAYKELLSSVSVGVFNFRRQQGLGNIRILMRSGAKIYVPKAGSLWSYYSNNGEAVFATEDIASLSFRDFTAYSEEAAARNFKAKDPVALYNEACNLWAKIYKDYGVLDDC